jgi:NAD(P)-dependent dehydrogenase (short-subunit alcohol dehydrogenase family)
MDTPSTRPVALVTGAASGIGKGCAIDLAKSGFNLLINDLNLELLEKLAVELQSLGAESQVFYSDISDLELHRPLLERAISRWGRIDCLLNNAGVSVKQRGDLLEATPESFDRCIDVNTRAVFFLSQTVARQMLAQGEIAGQHRSIINITSSNATMVSISRAEYCISKAASSMITRLLGVRLAEEGIGVYEIRPGIIETEMTRPVKAKYDEFFSSGRVPIPRWGKPADVASTVTCMAEGRLIYTVGQAIAVDGGLAIPHY